MLQSRTRRDLRSKLKVNRSSIFRARFNPNTLTEGAHRNVCSMRHVMPKVSLIYIQYYPGSVSTIDSPSLSVQRGSTLRDAEIPPSTDWHLARHGALAPKSLLMTSMIAKNAPSK